MEFETCEATELVKPGGELVVKFMRYDFELLAYNCMCVWENISYVVFFLIAAVI